MKTLGTYYTYFAFSGTNTPNQYTAGGVTYMNDVRFRFIVKEDVDTTNNKSTIEVDKYVNYINNLGGGSTLDFTLYSIVNGSSKASTKNNVSPGSTTSSWTFVGTSEYDIDHEDDGSGSITFNGRGYYVGGSGTAYNTYTGTKTIKLTKIDRASTITNNTTSGSRKDFGVNVTFSIDRPSSSTKHTLTYKVGSTTYTIGSGITTSKTYAFPTSLISKFTSTATPNITVTCKSSNGTSSSTTVYLKVPNTYVPTCSLSLTDAMNNKPSSLSGLWIKNKSLLKGTITASGIAGSTIKSYLSTVSGSSTNYNTNPFTTTALSNSGEMTVTSKVTDTRGRTNTDTETINVIDYDNPAFITAKVERCNSDGTLNELGTYGKVTCKYKIYPINNGTTNLNTKTLTVKMGSGTPQEISLTNFEDTVTAVLFSDISNNNSYQFTFTLTDIFGPQTQTFALGIAYVTESKRAGGKGISFGQIASKDGFNVYMDAEFNNVTQFNDDVNVDGDFTINERKIYPNDNIICVTNSALYELTQTNVYEQIQNLVIENQLGSDLSLVDNAIVIGEGISKILVNFSLTYDGVGGVGAKFIRLSKNEVDNGYRMLSKSNISTSGTQNYRIFMNSGDVLIDVVKGDKIMLFVYGTAGDTIPRNTFNYFIFTVRAVA